MLDIVTLVYIDMQNYIFYMYMCAYIHMYMYPGTYMYNVCTMTL